MNGGTVRITDSSLFKASKTIAAALVEIEPGGMRELHWHPNVDEWQYYISGQARMTIFAAENNARTFNFQTGDVGSVPFATGHYIENIGTTTRSRRVTVALGVSLIAHALFLDVWFATKGHPPIDVAHMLLGLWGLAMGVQSAAVRRLHVDGVFTTAATATLIFLVGDVINWRATAAERRRLAGVLISMFFGATAGGLLLVHAHMYAPVLPFAITLAVVATATIVLPERSAT